MQKAVSDLSLMISEMEPVLNSGVYVYVSLPQGSDLSNVAPVVTVSEVEGLTLVLPEVQASLRGLKVMYRCAWITLNVHSALDAFGLTAAFSKALAEEQISCNVVAGAYHDHIFVPAELGMKAMEALKKLQASYKSNE